jgi:hypothetical protein
MCLYSLSVSLVIYQSLLLFSVAIRNLKTITNSPVAHYVVEKIFPYVAKQLQAVILSLRDNVLGWRRGSSLRALA